MVKISKAKEWYIVSTQYENENIQSLANRLSGGKSVDLLDKYFYWNQTLDNYDTLFVKDNLFLDKNSAYWIYVKDIKNSENFYVCKNLKVGNNTSFNDLRLHGWNLVSTDREEDINSLVKRISDTNNVKIYNKYYSLSGKSSKYDVFDSNKGDNIEVNKGYWVYITSFGDIESLDDSDETSNLNERLLLQKLYQIKKKHKKEIDMLTKDIDKRVEESHKKHLKIIEDKLKKTNITELSNNEIMNSNSLGNINNEIGDLVKNISRKGKKHKLNEKQKNIQRRKQLNQRNKQQNKINKKIDSLLSNPNNQSRKKELQEIKNKVNRLKTLEKITSAVPSAVEGVTTFEKFTAELEYLLIKKNGNKYEFFLKGLNEINHNHPVLRHILRTSKLENVNDGKNFTGTDTYLAAGSDTPVDSSNIFLLQNSVNWKHLNNVTWNVRNDMTLANTKISQDYKVLQIKCLDGKPLHGSVTYRYADPTYKFYYSYTITFVSDGSFSIISNKREYPDNIRKLYVRPSDRPSIAPYFIFSYYKSNDYRYKALNTRDIAPKLKKKAIYFIERDDPADRTIYPMDISYDTHNVVKAEDESVILQGGPLNRNLDQKIVYVHGYDISNPMKEFDPTYDKLGFFSTTNNLMKGHFEVDGKSAPDFNAAKLDVVKEHVLDHIRVIREGQKYSFYLTDFDITNHNTTVERHFISTDLQNVEVGENIFEDTNTYLASKTRVDKSNIYNFNNSKSWDKFDNVSWYTSRDYTIRNGSRTSNYKFLQIVSETGKFLIGTIDYIYADPSLSFYKKYTIRFNVVGDIILSSKSTPEWVPNFRKVYVQPTEKPAEGLKPYYDFYPSKPTESKLVNDVKIFRLNGDEYALGPNGHLEEVIRDYRTPTTGDKMLLIKGVHYIFEWYRDDDDKEFTTGPMNFKFTQKQGTADPITLHGSSISKNSDQLILYIKDFGFDPLNPWNEFNVNFDTLSYYSTDNPLLTMEFNVQDREMVGYTFMGSALEKGWVDRWWDDTNIKSIKKKIEGKKLALIVDGTVLKLPETINFDSTSDELLRLKDTIVCEEKKSTSLNIIAEKIAELNRGSIRSERQLEKIKNQQSKMMNEFSNIKSMTDPGTDTVALIDWRREALQSIAKLEIFLTKAVSKANEVYNDDLSDISDIKENLKILGDNCVVASSGVPLSSAPPSTGKVKLHKKKKNKVKINIDGRDMDIFI